MSGNARGLFVTGTDTEVGKTHAAAMIARRLVADGTRVGVYKPLASGCIQQGAELTSEDAVALWQAAGRPDDLHRVCPQRFAAPIAPHLAARAEGKSIDRALLRTGLDYWRPRCEVLLVEGAGGLLSPADVGPYYMSDLARECGFPLVVVARNALGVINHALLTLRAAESAGLEVAALVLNQIDASDQDSSIASNADELRSRCDVPVFCEVRPHGSEFLPSVDWNAVARASRPPRA
ncbi:MAG: dethiobiotin synthase [Planctomycetales bacterium]